MQLSKVQEPIFSNFHYLAFQILIYHRSMLQNTLWQIQDEDFYKGIAQNAVQLESALSNRKRKASEMEEGDVFTGKTFGIITDAEKWYFMECSLDNEGKPSFKLSEQ